MWKHRRRKPISTAPSHRNDFNGPAASVVFADQARELTIHADVLVLLPDSASAHVCLDIAEDAARAIQGRMAAAHIGAPDAMIAAPEEIDLQMLRDLEEGTPRERLESGGIT